MENTQEMEKLELVSKETLMDYVEKAKSLYEKKNEDLSKNVYETKLTKEGHEMLLDYFNHKVNWEWSQAIGIIEIVKALKAIQSFDNVLFKGLTIQAICYHLSKYKGIGIGEAVPYVELLLNPFNDALQLVNTDTEFIKKLGENLGFLDMQLGAINQGLEVEKTEKIKEIEKMLA
jgi:hypothetical protein